MSTKVPLFAPSVVLERCHQSAVCKAEIGGRCRAFRGNRGVVATEDEMVVELYVAHGGYLLDSLGEIYVIAAGLQMTRGVVVC